MPARWTEENLQETQSEKTNSGCDNQARLRMINGDPGDEIAAPRTDPAAPRSA
jgi:hypothetical protein